MYFLQVPHPSNNIRSHLDVELGDVVAVQFYDLGVVQLVQGALWQRADDVVRQVQVHEAAPRERVHVGADERRDVVLLGECVPQRLGLTSKKLLG